MEPVLIRTYHTDGTNGTLYINGMQQCHCIELPWKDNQPRISCIPEGRYELKKRYSPKFGHHLLVTGVPDRSFILIHPANDAIKELKGCIAPVSVLTGPGIGTCSRAALEKIRTLIYAALEKGPVFLTIQSEIK